MPPTFAPPLPLRPIEQAQRLPGHDAHLVLERYRVLAMALAARAIARQWDSGLIAHQAQASFVANADRGFPFEQEVLSYLGVTRGLATATLSACEDGVQFAHDAVIRSKAEGAPDPLTHMARDFQLQEIEHTLLILIAASQLWGDVHALYGLAQHGERHRGNVDEALLVRLLGPTVNPHLVARALAKEGALSATGLIHIDRSIREPHQPIATDPLVLHRLRGHPFVTDPDGESVVVMGDPSDELVISPTVLERITEWCRLRTGALVFRGRPGSGRRTIASALAAAAGRPLALIDLATAPMSDALGPWVERAVRRARIAGWVPCLSGVETLSENHSSVARVRRVLENHPESVILRLPPESEVPLAGGYSLVDLPALESRERRRVWTTQLTKHQLNATLADELANAWQITPGAVATACRLAGDALGGASNADHHQLINRVVSGQLAHRLGTVAERVTSLPSLADVVLPADLLDSLTEFLARRRLNSKVYDDWGLARIATSGRGLTALFSGPPGTGKTMVAGALARELGMDLYRVDLSRIMSKWIGETERNLANVFAAAEEGHAVILFDEADSLFARRTDVKSANDRHANLEVNYLLQRLDSFLGIAILTTNAGTAIDPAFKRRITTRLTFPIPDEELREQLWQRHLPSTIPTDSDVDLKEIATRFHFAGGAIRNCALRAAFLAAAENRPLGQSHLVRAIRLEYRAAGKLSEGGPLE